MFAAWRDEDIAALGVDKSNSLKEAMTEEAELPLEEISRVTAAFYALVNPTVPAVACASCGVSEIPIVGEDKAAVAALSAKFGIKQFHVVHLSDAGLL